MNELKRIIELVNKNNKFLITAHENPDCDALGSTLALGFALEKLNKEADFYNFNKTPEHLKFLPGWNKITNDVKKLKKEYECIFILDSADDLRPGIDFHNFVKTQKNSKIIVIDHHSTNSNDKELVWVDVNAASTGVLIYKLIKELGIELNTDISNLIYSTIVGDTGSFRFANTNSESFSIASDLVDNGADPEKISQAIYENEPLNKINLIARALNTLEIDDTGKIASVYIDTNMFKETNTTRDHTEGIINIPRRINGVSVAVLLRQEDNGDKSRKRWKISLRSKDNIDVSLIAKKFGGGGHVKASGCSIEGELNSVKKTLYETIEKEFR